MWFPVTIERTTLLSVRGALNRVFWLKNSVFPWVHGSCRWLLCVCFSCVSLDQSTSSSLPWCMCQFRCGWDRPTHIEIRKWKNLNEYCTSTAWSIYIHIYVHIICIYFMSTWLYILCVWKWSWAVLSFFGCFLDEVFTVVSICTPRMAYFLKSENIFSIFRFVQAVSSYILKLLQLVLCFIQHSQ